MTIATLIHTPPIWCESLFRWEKEPHRGNEGRTEACVEIRGLFIHSLTLLNLSNLALTSLPPCMRYCFQLKIICLSNNHLHNFPESLPHSSLNNILVDSNRISTLLTLFPWRKGTVINLKNNPLTEETRDFLCNREHLPVFVL